MDPDKWEFANKCFLKGQKHLLKNIIRRKPTHFPTPLPALQIPGPCIEVGKFGLEEEIEWLKRDKNILVQELVKLRQQQQSTDHQLRTLSHRLQSMDQRQQQMMSFLAKALHNPSFLAQLVVHQQAGGVAKKQRLPTRQEFSNGQIVKYQPVEIRQLSSEFPLTEGQEISAGIEDLVGIGDDGSSSPGISDEFWEQFLMPGTVGSGGEEAELTGSGMDWSLDGLLS